MDYYYGDLNIAMLKNCERKPLDLYHLKMLKFYYNLCCNRLPQYFNVYHNVTQEYNFSYNLCRPTRPLRLPFTSTFMLSHV